MTDTVIHMVGHVGTEVDHRRVGTGTDLSTFRLATTPRRWDRQQRQYVDDNTNWITVQCWRSLAAHVRDSIRRGEPVIVIGKLKTDAWVKDGVKNSRFVLEATAVGHDLSRGIGRFKKMSRQPEAAADDTDEALDAVREIEQVEPVDYQEYDEGSAPLADAS